jgi:hypothetical protein
MSAEAQALATQSFENAIPDFLPAELERIEFDGRYKPDSDEILEVSNFTLPAGVSESIADPLGCEPLILDRENLPAIKALFTVTEDDPQRLVFQIFKKNQYLTRRGLSLLFSGETFAPLSAPGIVITPDITAVYENGSLLFRSYFEARQVFELAAYYRQATDSDLSNFSDLSSVHIADPEAFNVAADQVVRRKIALILDSGLLDRHTPENLATEAEKFGIELNLVEVEGDTKLDLPSERSNLKNILRFLDEDIYHGPLSAAQYVTNSKRRLT